MAHLSTRHLVMPASLPPHPPSPCICFLLESLLLYPPTASFDLCPMRLQCILYHLQKADGITVGPLCLFKPVISRGRGTIQLQCSCCKNQISLPGVKAATDFNQQQIKTETNFYSKYKALGGFRTDFSLQCL